MALLDKRHSTVILGTLAGALALIAAARAHPRADLAFVGLFLAILWAVGGWIRIGLWYAKDLHVRRLGKDFKSRAQSSLRYLVDSESNEVPYEVSAGLNVIFGEIDRYERKSSNRKTFVGFILAMLLSFAAQAKITQIDVNTVEISALSPVELLRLVFFVLGYYFSLVPSALAKQQGQLQRALQQSFIDLTEDFSSDRWARRESESVTRSPHEQGGSAEGVENEAVPPSSVAILNRGRTHLPWNNLMTSISGFATIFGFIYLFDKPPISIGLDFLIALAIILCMLIVWRVWNGRDRT
jgi:hypothetical protein